MEHYRRKYIVPTEIVHALTFSTDKKNNNKNKITDQISVRQNGWHDNSCQWSKLLQQKLSTSSLQRQPTCSPDFATKPAPNRS